MTSTSMPFMPVVTANVGFLAQQTYGAPGSPYLQPLAPSNGAGHHSPQNAYGPIPWMMAKRMANPGAFGTPDVLGSCSHLNYSDGSLPSSNTGGSANGGAATETMQPAGLPFFASFAGSSRETRAAVLPPTNCPCISASRKQLSHKCIFVPWAM